MKNKEAIIAKIYQVKEKYRKYVLAQGCVLNSNDLQDFEELLKMVQEA